MLLGQAWAVPGISLKTLMLEERSSKGMNVVVKASSNNTI
jgi:hypothetical protein